MTSLTRESAPKKDQSSILLLIKQKALALQARREHSQFELKRKLMVRGFPEAVVMQALNWLVEQTWQSDAVFTERYVFRRMQSGYGPLRICTELRARGIGDELINRYLLCPDQGAPSREEWQEIIMAVWRKKIIGKAKSSFYEDSAALLAKQATSKIEHQKEDNEIAEAIPAFNTISWAQQNRFLSQRGFTNSQIRDCLNRFSSCKIS